MSLPLVLLYHAIAPIPATPDLEERRMFVDPTAFEKQMDHLARRGFRSLRLDQYAAVVEGARAEPRSVLVTFDDAYAHVDQVVSPILRRHNFTAVMFACPAHLGGKNTWDPDNVFLSQLAIATPQQLREMSAGPWEIASHGLNHVDLRALSPRQRLGQLVTARERLSEVVGRPVVDLAYPFGLEDGAVRRDVARAGYRMAFLASSAGGTDPHRLPRRPLTDTDSMATFRLKTHRYADGLYRMHERAPFWARSAARSLLEAAGR